MSASAFPPFIECGVRQGGREMDLTIDQVNAIIAPTLPGSIGIRFTEVAPGRSVCQLTVNETMHNPGGVLHGGVHYTLADTGMAIALLSIIEEGQLFTTVEIKISYFKPVIAGAITCATQVVNKGRRIAHLESELRDESRVVAKATGTYYIAAS